MSGLSKVGVVFGGYAAALAAAVAVFYALEWWSMSQPDAGGAMQGFGDLIAGLGVFAVLALVPTAAAVYFLRPFEKLWTGFSIACLALAATGPVAAVMIGRHLVSPWAAFIVGFFGLLRLFGTPVLGCGFLVCAFIAPARRERRALFAAALVEAAVATYIFFTLFLLHHWL